MITDSPHLYRATGQRLGKEPKLVEHSLQQAAEVEERGLASVLTLGHLAHNTGVGYYYLREVAKRSIDPYDDLVLPRRNGRKMRAISSPRSPLLEVQRWILHRIVERLPAHPNSFAYTPGSSIKACAQKHLGAGWLVKLDIRNFFETINEAQVYEVFLGAGYRPLPSVELARICTRYAGHARHVSAQAFRHRSTYRVIKTYSRPLMGFLPQGAPTSGSLANQVARKLDDELSVVAASRELVYTRYADDMVFSSSGDFRRKEASSIIREVEVLLRSYGFEPHSQKTRIVPPGARKIVLGLLVDGPVVRINRKMRSRLLRHIRGVEAFGLQAHVAHVGFSSIEGLVRHVSGLLAFASDIEPEWAESVEKRWTAALQRDGWSIPEK
ncbi:reverse transcriptase family protein [Streptomyces sp. CRN 30]|uniref:reverse transcriptase family protein n=1 Tax=Streptomyces sp. CRN 30 TaxID=3075613 RepID=UPI002A81F1B7|nr:reverse transcriptase family protein [Streptomyces sp. CRN 30]